MISSTCLGRASVARLGGATVAGLLACLLAAPAQAKNCGDNVEGARVACACGDIVVSDTTLRPTDPVASEPCSRNGLVVLAPPGSEGLTLHLGGQSIVGRGRGAGIRVVRGGSLGSVIVGGDAGDTRAEIANFETGIRAHGAAVLREVRAVDVHDNTDNGLKLRTSGVRVMDVNSRSNGGDGVSLSGHGVEVSGVASEHNAGDGLKVRGAGATVEGETRGNGRHGAVIGGRGAVVQSVRSSGNGGAGLMATGSGHVVADLEASDNAGGDVAGRAGATK